MIDHQQASHLEPDDTDYARAGAGPLDSAEIALRCFVLQLNYIADVIDSLPRHIAFVVAREHGVLMRVD